MKQIHVALPVEKQSTNVRHEWRNPFGRNYILGFIQGRKWIPYNSWNKKQTGIGLELNLSKYSNASSLKEKKKKKRWRPTCSGITDAIIGNKICQVETVPVPANILCNAKFWIRTWLYTPCIKPNRSLLWQYDHCVTTVNYNPYKINADQWPRGLRLEMSLHAQTMRSWVPIALQEWMSVRVYCVCVVLCR
jgi:hypothetical protein